MREMKDSGVAWIGEIPEDWNVGKTLYALSMPITDGPHETPELFDEGIPFISAEAVSCGNGRTGTRSGSCSCCCGSRLFRWFPAWPSLPQRSGAALRCLPCSLFPAVSGAVNSAIRLSRFLTSFPCPVIRAARS